jgi:ubiquinone/menaquinone biosynthesis C-methylase UbiE
MTGTIPQQQNNFAKDKLAAVARMLVCPDCGQGLDAALRCPSCGRSFVPEADGIISALPKRMSAERQDKDTIKKIIDTAGAGDHGETIVLYEKAFHDEQAAYYDKLFANPLPLSEYYRRLVRRQIYAHVRGRSSVVDLCCGTGKSSMPLVERGMLVVGMDVSREMLHVYRQKCDAQGRKNVILIHADASHPPLRNGSCEAITMIGGLHHIQERAESVNACCQALAENGLFILHEPLHTGKTSGIAVFVENLYALADLPRVWRALKRRLGLKVMPPAAAEAMEDFTPYEKPFRSAAELEELIPPGMRTLVLRSQGLLGFREFPGYLQARAGRLAAAVVVWLDAILAGNHRTEWLGDALFAVFQKSGGAPQDRGQRAASRWPRPLRGWVIPK